MPPLASPLDRILFEPTRREILKRTGRLGIDAHRPFQPSRLVPRLATDDESRVAKADLLRSMPVGGVNDLVFWKNILCSDELTPCNWPTMQSHSAKIFGTQSMCANLGARVTWVNMPRQRPFQPRLIFRASPRKWRDKDRVLG